MSKWDVVIGQVEQLSDDAEFKSISSVKLEQFLFGFFCCFLFLLFLFFLEMVGRDGEEEVMDRESNLRLRLCIRNLRQSSSD